jgi:peroxiredoxin Q/BCP
MNQQTAAVVDQPAPDFTLRDESGGDWRLSGQRGKTVVLIFYPKDGTPVCTKQLCSVRDNWEAYRETGAEVAAISTDSVESHKRFAENRKLPMHLLSDPKGEVSKLYGASSWLPGRAARAFVVIDANGVVRHHKVQSLSLFRPSDTEVLDAIRAAQN